MANEKERILVADDMDFSRGILRMLLRKDYEVVDAADGLQAVDILLREGDSIACILLDIKMPGMDGYGVLDYMRGAGLMDRIPVIALTAMTDPQGHIKCYESGAVDLIEKPFNEELLLYKVKWVLARARRLREALAGASPASVPSEGVPPRVENAVTKYCRETYGLETAEEVDDMFQSFLRTFSDCARRLQDMQEEPDFRSVRDVTHDIFGFASGSGARDLDDLARMLNVCAKAEDRASVCAGIRRILDLYVHYRGSWAR